MPALDLSRPQLSSHNPSANTSTESQRTETQIHLHSHTLPSPFNFTQPAPTLLTQGAEALVYKTTFLDHETSPIPAALKFRPSKKYRHPTLDARLTKQRVLAEARVLVKLAGLASDAVRVPGVLALEWDVGRKIRGSEGVNKYRTQVAEQGEGKGAWILLEWIEGRSVKELLRAVDSYVKSREVQGMLSDEERERLDGQVKALLRRVGRAVGVMHALGGVIHGDLTSSNVMVRPDSSTSVTNGKNGLSSDRNITGKSQTETVPPELDGEIVLIDFGLATQSVHDEDRAVDLYVLERAFGSTHPRQESWFDAEVLQHEDGYRGAYKQSRIVLKRLEEVRMRGRKRSMIG